MTIDLSGLPVFWQVVLVIVTFLGWLLVLIEIVLPVFVLAAALGIILADNVVNILMDDK